MEFTAATRFLRQTHDGLKEVAPLGPGPVKVGDQAALQFPAETVISKDLADVSAVLLFDPAVAVFLQRPRAQEGDLILPAVIDQELVENGAVIVGMQFAQPKRQTLADAMESAAS